MEDRRIRHTKQRLEDALLDILQHKNINMVSVSELCKQADINRNTFYAHYQTPMDILKEIEERYYHAKIKEYDDAIVSGDIRVLLKSALEISSTNDKALSVILNPNSGSTVREELSHEIAQRIIRVWVNTRKMKSVDEVKWTFAFLSGGMASLLQTWHDDSSCENIDAVFAFMQKATRAITDVMFDA